MEKMADGFPMVFKKTEVVNLEGVMENIHNKTTEESKREKLNISVKDVEEFALNWWDKYYDEWIRNDIPALGGVFLPEKRLKQLKAGKK